MIYTKEHIYKKNTKKTTTTTDMHNNKKLRNLYTGINIHRSPTSTHMIAEPFDSSVRMKWFNLCFHR